MTALMENWAIRSDSLDSAEAFCKLLCRSATPDNFESRPREIELELNSKSDDALDKLDMARFALYWVLRITDDSPLSGIASIIESHKKQLDKLAAEVDERSEDSEEDETPEGSRSAERLLPRVAEVASPPFGPTSAE